MGRVFQLTFWPSRAFASELPNHEGTKTQRKRRGERGEGKEFLRPTFLR